MESTGLNQWPVLKRPLPPLGRSGHLDVELVNRDSPYFPLHNAAFALPPYRGRWPEIWIAARKPRMLGITGRYADAWFPGLLSQPDDYAAGLDSVRIAASNAGRDPAESLRRFRCSSSPAAATTTSTRP